MVTKESTACWRYAWTRFGGGVLLCAALLTPLHRASAQVICPLPPDPFIPVCIDRQSVDCDTGQDTDQCHPISVTVDANGEVVAEQCACFVPDGSCGPVNVLGDPADPTLSCEKTCPTADSVCLIHRNGSPTQDPFIPGSSVAAGEIITCDCVTQLSTYQNWVIADDFCVVCHCDCDLHPDGVCDQNDVALMQDCFNAGNPPSMTCRKADLNCDGVLDAADLAIFSDLYQGVPPDIACEGTVRPVVDHLRWYGSWIDREFDPLFGATRFVDGWLVALHRDIPPKVCPPLSSTTAKSFDYCCTLEDCGAGLVCRPKGSSYTYNLIDPGNQLAGFGPGDMIRICGEVVPLDPDLCSTSLADVLVNSVLTCESAISRPDRLIAQWAFAPGDVRAELAPSSDGTAKVGWDGHPIWCYDANLPDACLEHDNRAPDEIGPNGSFLPRPGRTYWISFQAEVGHAVNKTISGGTCSNDPTRTCTSDADCGPILGVCSNGPDINCIDDSDCPTGAGTCGGSATCLFDVTCTFDPVTNSATQDFWGWHTTPPGHQRKDDAYMGQLLMGNPDEPCADDWFYNWMNHLHCSDPAFFDCCDDPTKSIDMAFYLIDRRRGFCEGTTTSCTSDADCADLGNVACVGGTDLIHWCQPVNPGPPPVPPEEPPFTPVPPFTPFPPGGIDEIPQTDAQMTVEIFGKIIGPIQLQGPTVVTRDGGPMPPDPYNPPLPLQIPIEILELQLTSADPIVVRLNPGRPSIGEIRSPDGGPFDLDSFFDVFVEVEFPPEFGLPPLHNDDPLRMEAFLPTQGVPPLGATYRGPPGGQPVPLLDPNGQPVGAILDVAHTLPYKGGVNMHSDVDWQSTPTTPCCEPDPSSITGCTADPCPTADEVCLPSCVGTDTAGNLSVIECDCVDESQRCHVTIDSTGAVSCAGGCPTAGETCVGPFLVDLDGDGIDDAWKCECGKVETGACCEQLAGAVGPTCTDNVTAANCNGTFFPNGNCLGIQACCDPATDTCGDIDALCCKDIGGVPQGPGTTCSDPGICGDVLCKLPDFYPWCDARQDTDCPSTNLDDTCLPRRIHFDPNGQPVIDACDCFPLTDDCGPIDLVPDPNQPGTFRVACPGVCQSGQNCWIHFDHNDGLGPQPTGTDVLNSSSIPPDVTVTCDCADKQIGACCYTGAAGPTCQDGVTQGQCDSVGGTFHLNGTCLGIEACCFADGSCADIDALCCADLGGTPGGVGSACQGRQACCDPVTGNCVDADATCCELNGGLPQGAGTDCTDPDICNPPLCPVPTSMPWCDNLQATDCVATAGNTSCLPATVTVSADGTLDVKSCDCFVGGQCGPVTIVENPPGMPPYTFVCEKNCPDPNDTCEVHLDGVPQGTVSILSDQVAPGQLVSCDCVPPPTELCPLPTEFPWCDNNQATDCIVDAADDIVCLVESVNFADPANPDVGKCACFSDVPGCGPVDIRPDPNQPGTLTVSCPDLCPDPSQLCLLHFDRNDGQGPQSTGASSLNSTQIPPDVTVTCDCFQEEIDCQPILDGLECAGVCPGTTQECVPKAIACDSTGDCRIVECGCNDENELCHVDFPPAGSTTPTCTGGCPPSIPGKKCVRRKVDTDGDGIKDAWGCRCVKIFPKPVPVPGEPALKNRYLTFQIPTPGGVAASSAVGGEQIGIRVTLDELHEPDPPNLECCPPPDFSSFNGTQMWVGPVEEFNNTIFPVTLFNGATLLCDPHFEDFVSAGAFSVYAAEVNPSSTYSIQTVSIDCMDSLEEEDCYSAAFVQGTGRWGDVREDFQSPGPPLVQPNVFDVTEVVDHLKGVPGASGKTAVQLHPNGTSPSDAVNITDVVHVVDALKGFAYPYQGPCECPSTVLCTVGDACEADNQCGPGKACINGACSDVDDCRRCTAP